MQNFRLDLFLAESSGTALLDEYLGIALAKEEVEERLHVVLLWPEVKETERRIFPRSCYFVLLGIQQIVVRLQTTKMRVSALLLLSAVCSVVFFSPFLVEGGGKVVVQQPAPDFTAEAVLHGEFKKVSLSDYEG